MIRHEHGVFIYPNGREVCDDKPQGRTEYKRRRIAMAERQGWACALCGFPMNQETCTFDHEFGRGMGGAKRDDRIELHGTWINAAVCWNCNIEKGSKHMPYLITQVGQ